MLWRCCLLPIILIIPMLRYVDLISWCIFLVLLSSLGLQCNVNFDGEKYVFRATKHYGMCCHVLTCGSV
jgi:hypothetical protein